MSGRRAGGWTSRRRMYMAVLQRSEAEFVSVLRDNIMQGPDRRPHVLLQLDMLQATHMTHLLHKAPPHSDESLLQMAAIFHGDVTVMTRLASLCPRLLLQQRQGEYEGQSVLHTLVSKQNVAGVAAVLQHPCLPEPWTLLNGKAVGPRFAATVMMGELPLSVAALTFNLEMVDTLLQHGAKLHEVNTRGDTVLHSLLRFAHLYPEKEAEVVRMMREVHSRLQAPETAPSPQVEPRSVWMVENEEGLTALRLAAPLALPSLFQLIVQLEGVYCQLDRHDGLFDSLLYDVTEIDPVARQQWRRVNTRHQRRHLGVVAPLSAEGIPSPTHPSMREAGCCPGLDTPAPSAMKGRKGEGDGGRFVSVLEILCETGRVDKALDMLNVYVVRSAVKAKWRHYHAWLVLWAVVHVALMVLLTLHAVFKAKLIRQARTPHDDVTPSPGNVTTVQGDPAHDSLASEAVYVKVMAVMTQPLAAVMVGWEVRRWWRRLSLNLRLIHHNGLYRLQLLLFGLSLVADSVWYWSVGPDNNFFLTLALLLGWWFCTFFLRPLRKFSFFTVMLQKVLLGDMLRFSTIILLELLAFSVAMYITFLSTPGELPEEFRHLGATHLTLFKLMLGLGEVEVLGKAAHPWLSTSLFVLFVVLTYLLMLNALIAMMSNTCSLVSENKVSQWQLQRLSVVLLLESMMPHQCLLYNSGRPMYVAGYDLRRKEMVQETRYFTKVTKVQTSYTEGGAAILKRKSMIQTQRFDDLHAVMTSVSNVMTSTGNVMTSVGNVAHLDLLASFTHQQALLGRCGLYDDSLESQFDSPDPVPYSVKAFSSPPHLQSYDAVSKSKEHASFRRRVNLPAIKERRQESEQKVGRDGEDGGGEGHSYISVRQTLLRALVAGQVAAGMGAHRRTRGAENEAPVPVQHLHSDVGTSPSSLPAAAAETSPTNMTDGCGEEPKPSPVPFPRSPHTPKSDRLTVHPPQQSPLTPTPSRTKRKRHNSKKTVRREPPPSHQQALSKSLQPLSDKAKSGSTSSEALAPTGLPVEGSSDRASQQGSFVLMTQLLSERKRSKGQSTLPIPDVFTIANNTPAGHTEA